MNNLIISRTFCLSKKLRVPAIKFRHGSGREIAKGDIPSTSQVSSSKQQSEEAIYDFQLADRFRRRPIDQDEIDYINRGGPA